MKRHRSKHRWLGGLLIAATMVAAIVICLKQHHGRQSKAKAEDASSLVLVTGYCSCGKCCGWRRSWFGFGPPVYTYGKMKGCRKKVGYTFTGKKARKGTIAADPRVFGFGTKLYVPGYGVGTVEDIGGAIKGRHIDIWFPTHAEALRWGVKKLKVVEYGKKRTVKR